MNMNRIIQVSKLTVLFIGLGTTGILVATGDTDSTPCCDQTFLSR